MEKRAITIVGLSGSGKSTVGKLLADALGLPFTDTDKEIERETGMSVPEIFDRLGEKAFREIEKRVVLRSIRKGGVVSLGGGAILDPENRKAILEDSVSFYIKVSIDELERRLRREAEDRPLLRGNLRERLESLYVARKELYEMAHFTIEGDNLSPEEACALMVFNLKGVFEEDVIYSSLHDVHVKRICWEEIGCFPVLTTSSVYRIYRPFIKEGGKLLIAPDGEEAKDLSFIERLYKTFIDWEIERKDTVVALGGGALTDAVGFATATFKRGCEFLSVPTTLLGQVDASIGGKTAINLGEIKNVIGAFKVPKLVLIDPTFVLSQDPKRFSEGLVEAIKIALVASRELFEFIEDNIDRIKKRDLRTLFKLIKTSVELKLRIAERDLFDRSLRQILNFGHTLGHAIESAYNMSHGEAVSLGKSFALKLGEFLGITERGILDRVLNLLKAIDMPVELRDLDLNRVYAKLVQDKKIKNGKVNFILVKNIGESIIYPISLPELTSYISRLSLTRAPIDLAQEAYRAGEVFQGER